MTSRSTRKWHLNISRGLCFCLLALTTLTTGCATIMNEDMVSVPVYTNPPDATVTVGGLEYRSPATVLVPRGKGSFKLTIEKEGYKPGFVILQQSIDAWVWGNALFTVYGLLGLLVDFRTGYAHDVEPEVVDYTLIREGEAGEELLEASGPVETGTSAVSTTSQLAARIEGLAKQLATGIKRHHITRVAVLPIGDASHAIDNPLSNYLTEKLTNTLYKTGSAKIVERSQLEKVINELALTMSGRFDDVSVKRIGQLLGVDALIMGIYTELGSHTVEVNSKIVSVETAEVLGVGTIQISRATVRRLL